MLKRVGTPAFKDDICVGFKTFFFCLLSFPILNPRGTGKDYIYIRNIMGCPMCSLGKENLVVKVVIKFSSLYIV